MVSMINAALEQILVLLHGNDHSDWCASERVRNSMAHVDYYIDENDDESPISQMRCPEDWASWFSSNSANNENAGINND